MEFKRKLKVRKLQDKQQIHESKPEVKLMDLPTEVLDMVASFLPRKHMKNFGLANKRCHQIFQQWGRKNIDLRKCLKVDEKKMLQVVKTRKYVSLNLKGCNWLSSRAVLELVSKDSVRELNLINCQCTPEVIEQIAKLNLTSLAFSLTKNWIDFFVSNEFNSIPRLRGLKKLKIFYLSYMHFANGFLVNHVFRYVLRHCPDLVYLKLSMYCVRKLKLAIRLTETETYETFQTQNIPTPVPKLETLILDVGEEYEENISEDVFNLVKLILNRKESPLKQIYLGNQTAEAITSGILCSKNISYEKTRTLCLSSNSYLFTDLEIPSPKIPDFLNVPGFESAVDSMLEAPSCKRIELDGLNLENIDIIAHKVIASGNTSIEEISLRGCYINGSKFICPPLLEIANVCPRINFLDMSSVEWNHSWHNNVQLMECLSNLTNLRTLYLTPYVLHSVMNIAKPQLKSSFRKLAEKCKFIDKLGLVNNSYNCDCPVPQDVLSHVKFFKNLQELYLVNFALSGTEHALPEIARSCARLTHLYIRNVYNKELNTSELPWKQIFVHTKQLKHLSLIDYASVTITKEFVYSLVECAQLEKLCVLPIYRGVVDASQYFADNLRKLTKLEVFVTTGSEEVVEDFRSAINEIEETKRPSFFGYAYDLQDTVLPMAHWHLLQYDHYERL